VAFSFTDKDDFNLARREILIRKIGHELLLQSGDSVSRVMPLNKVSQNEYQIKFENAMSILPDSLVNISQRLLGRDKDVADYVVNILNCDNAHVAYGYAIANNTKDDIVSCKGRKLPTACYIINIKFKPTVILNAKNGMMLGGLTIFAFVGFMFMGSVKPKKVLHELSDTQYNNTFQLGSILFDVTNRKLILKDITTDLTATEARVLRIFAISPNETIERSRLQKEIWEDEGIIVGRSLDMFISKLRKKLELDSNIKIMVIRGKGYKLEINA
jgi:DNA-binding winged helix-turn-helix (wHTH) protein